MPRSAKGRAALHKQWRAGGGNSTRKGGGPHFDTGRYGAALARRAGDTVMKATMNQRGFRRDYLPTSLAYYEKALHISANHAGWQTVRCPFHDDKHASLSVNLEHGGFRCHACGAKGGDILAFHMRRHDLGFKAAAKELGAWV